MTWPALALCGGVGLWLVLRPPTPPPATARAHRATATCALLGAACTTYAHAPLTGPLWWVVGALFLGVIAWEGLRSPGHVTARVGGALLIVGALIAAPILVAGAAMLIPAGWLANSCGRRRGI